MKSSVFSIVFVGPPVFIPNLLSAFASAFAFAFSARAFFFSASSTAAFASASRCSGDFLASSASLRFAD
jgi:hypothetical protein